MWGPFENYWGPQWRHRRCELCEGPRYGGGETLLILEGVALCPRHFEDFERKPTVEDQRRRRLDLQVAA